MAGYIILDVKTKKIIGICVAIGIFVFIIGILIGFFSNKSNSSSKPGTNAIKPIAQAIHQPCGISKMQHSKTAEMFLKRYSERNNKNSACVVDPSECLNFGLPRHYVAYHLDGKKIVIDGKMDEEAWKEVVWSEDFVDMRGEIYPKPFYTTKFKMRWNNDQLYIGAFIQEHNLYATTTEHDNSISNESDFEMLIDVDGTMFNYKQVQINVLGTMMDQMLYKSPYDAVQETVYETSWHPNSSQKVFVKGTVNRPGDTDEYWSVEMALSFLNLKMESERILPEPQEDEVWFVQFVRSDETLDVVNGVYNKKPSGTSWWSWQQVGAINPHLQDRWGLVQFKRQSSDREFKFSKWHIYKALFDMMDGMKKFKALNGRFVDTIEELDIPPYLLSRACVDIPDIELINRNGTTGFDITVRSMYIQHKPAHIREDRYVYFQ